MNGFFRKVLVADATTRRCRTEELPAELLAGVLGGKGLGTWLLTQHMPAGAPPLAPEVPLVFAVGPTTDSRVPGSARYGVFTKSPQTGCYSESYSGGKLAEKLSRTGLDAVVLTGAADAPVVLEVGEEGARFTPAGDLWGRETYAAEDALVERFGGPSRAGAAVIGPAGERQVPFAILANDRWRCAGRTGPGAALGAKGVKGVVFFGGARRPLADPEGVAELGRRMFAELKDHPATRTYRTWGTPSMVSLVNTAGAFPTRYWRQGRRDGFGAISAEAIHERCAVRPVACPRCFLACGKRTTVRGGRHAGLTLEGPEYETLYAFGGLALIDSVEEVAYLNDRCDRLGLDTISAGNLVAFAMEASRLGAIPEAIPYGDADAAATLLDAIARREGLGAVLAQGIRGAAREFGLEHLAIHVKGLEPAGYDPRLLKGMGLAYATSDRGACHLRTTFYKPELAGHIAPAAVEGKAELLVDYEDRLNLFDALILCRFFRDFYPWDGLAEAMRLTTGLDLGADGVRAVARRVADGARRFNLQEGLTAADDWLPDRFFDEPLPETGAVLTREELSRMRAEYYRARGWDEAGRPAEG